MTNATPENTEQWTHESELKEARRILKKESIPTTRLEKTFKRHYQNKEEIHTALNFTPANGYRLEIPLPKDFETCPALRRLLLTVCDISAKQEDGNTYEPYDLTFCTFRKNKIKTTKIINALWPKLTDRERFRDLAYDAGYRGTFQSDTPQQFLIWYGEQVKNGRKGIISGRALDILTASYNASFHSCIAPDGEYFNTVLDYLESDKVIIQTIEEDGRQEYKIGRQWVFITRDIIAQLRQYGTFLESDSRIMRLELEKLLGGKWTRRAESLKTNDIEYYGQGYIDYGYGDYATRTGTEHRRMDIAEGKCLECGDTLNHQTGGTCRGCSDDGYSCASCGDRLSDDNRYRTDDDDYCESCYHDRFAQCENCGESVDNDFIRTVYRERDGRQIAKFYCEDCRNDNTNECQECGLFFVSEMTTTENGDMYCQQCADKNLIDCQECGEILRRKDAEEIDGAFYCEECATTKREEDEEEGDHQTTEERSATHE